MVKAKDKIAMQKAQERDKVKAEVVAEYQAAANNFVAEEIARARQQMQQDMERELQTRLAQAQLANAPVLQQQPRNTFRDHVSQQLSQLGTHQVFDEMELVSDVNEESKQSESIDTMREARMQRKKNKLAANVIGNRSMMDS